VICISAIYENAAGSRFDGAYYVGRHAALAEALLRPHGLCRIRASLGIAALDGAAPPYHAISEMIFADRAAFDAAMAACGEALFADSANYTDVAPVLQLSSWADTPTGVI
jgi:uncharacterized protein (TIGR02118 family)